MINLEIACRDFRSIEDALGVLPPIGGRELVHLPATRRISGGGVCALEKVLEVAVVARRGGWPRGPRQIPTSHARIGGFVAWKPSGLRKEISPTVSTSPANTDPSHKYSSPSEQDTDLSRKVADS